MSNIQRYKIIVGLEQRDGPPDPLHIMLWGD